MPSRAALLYGKTGGPGSSKGDEADKGKKLERSFNQEVSLMDHNLLRETFEAFDLDGSGTVEFEEVEAMVTSMGMVISPVELYDMLKEADDDGNDVIDFHEFKKVVESHIVRASDDPESPGGKFAALIQRKACSGPPMHWREDKLGPNLARVAEDVPGRTFRRDAGGRNMQPLEISTGGYATGKWGVQLLDAWLSEAGYAFASVLIEIESESGAFMVGVVGSNYNPGDWAQPLDTSKTAVAVRAVDGKVFVKGKNQPHAQMCKMPMKGATKCRISLAIDMCKLEMRIKCVDPDAPVTGADVAADEESEGASVLVEGLPVEVAVAVALGPSKTVQTVRVLGSSSERLEREDKDRPKRASNATAVEGEVKKTLEADTSDLGDTPAKGKTKQKNEEMAAIARTMGA